MAMETRDKELRDLATRLATDALDLYVNGSRRWQFIKERDELSEVIFRELVAVRDATIKKVLVYEADVAAYEAYCADRGEKP